jgi:hypothetical protein
MRPNYNSSHQIRQRIPHKTGLKAGTMFERGKRSQTPVLFHGSPRHHVRSSLRAFPLTRGTAVNMMKILK